MIDIKRQLHIRTAHAVDQLGTVSDIVEEVAGVVDVGVEDFHDSRDPVFLQHRRGRSQRCHGIRHLLRTRHSAQLVSRQGHQLRAVQFPRCFTRETHLPNKLLPFAGIHQTAPGRAYALVPHQALATERVLVLQRDEGLERVRVAPIEHLVSVIPVTGEQRQGVRDRHAAEHAPGDRKPEALRGIRRRRGPPGSCGRRFAKRDTTQCCSEE